MEHEVQVFNMRDFFHAFKPETAEIPFPGYWVGTVTGRAAMLPVLTHLRNKGTLASKNSQVLVPKWLCNSFMQMMRKHCSPTLDPEQPIRAALVYHQYGFPQNMDEIMDYCDRKKIVVIEDCANLFEGDYKGKRLGTIGYAGIFSLSKVFPSIWGGGLSTADEELYLHALKTQNDSHSSFVSGLLHMTRYLSDRRRERPSKNIQMWTEMAYGPAENALKMSAISKKIILRQLREGQLEKRKRNYRFLLKQFESKSYFSGLEREGVCPYVAPLFASEDRLKKISESLRANGFDSGVYSFDVNRNVFNPKFVRCAWVPIHQGLSLEQMGRISEIIGQSGD